MKVIKLKEIEIYLPLKLKLKLFKFTLLALILLAEINFNVLQSSLAYNTALSTKNHNYPVYPLLTMTLNGQSKKDLKAQTKIYNESLGIWETNYAFINKIQEDLNVLIDNITYLKQATIYDFNTSFIPGNVYILLSPSTLSSAGEVANDTINFILTHKEFWWYVKNVFYDVIDLKVFDIENPRHPFDVLKANHPNLIEVLDVFDIGFDMLIFIKKVVNENGSVSYILDPNSYSIINNTIIVNYTRRDDVFATFYIYDGKNWTIYSPFIEYLNETLNLLNDQYIFKNNDVKILSKFTDYHFLQKDLEGKLYVAMATGANMTPVVNENTTVDDIARIIDIGTTDAFFEISYTSKYSVYYQYLHQDELFKNNKEKWNEVLQFFIIIYTLLNHTWFCKEIGHDYTSKDIACNGSIGLPTVMISVLTLALVVTIHKQKDRKRYETQ